MAARTEQELWQNPDDTTVYERKLLADVGKLEQEVAQLKERIRLFEASTSWRVTAPLRRISAAIQS